jgi:hypothetical protein
MNTKFHHCDDKSRPILAAVNTSHVLQTEPNLDNIEDKSIV